MPSHSIVALYRRTPDGFGDCQGAAGRVSVSIMFTVAIIGRPNVGKSTLFNRILGRRQAIVQDLPGVTRDRHYADCEYRGRSFRVIDTGGLVPSSQDRMFGLIREQSRRAIDEADAVIFVLRG